MSVDAKGRTSMPARFREVMEEHLPARQAKQVVVVPWFDGCLRVMPTAVWDAHQDEFERRSGADDIFQLDEQESDLRRFIFGMALDVTLDGQGRVLLPQDLRDHAGIDRDVYWVGVGAAMEIWQPERFQARFSADRAQQFRRALEARRPGASPGAPGGGAEAGDV